MKKFLTVSTFCLALAAVATTKANGRFNEIGYTQDPDTGFCTVASTVTCSSDTGAGCKDGSGNQLFRFISNAHCATQLKKLP